MDGAIAINPVSDCKARRIWTESSYAANASGAGNSRQHQEVLAFTAKNLGSVRGQVSRHHVDDDLPCPEHGVGDVFGGRFVWGVRANQRYLKAMRR
jgi:hypothetical protein